MSPMLRYLSMACAALIVAATHSVVALATPLSAADRAQLSAGHPVTVIVEFDSTAVDQAAAAERARRGLVRDDAAVLALRASGYARIKSVVESRERGPDAAKVRDYAHFPLSVWRLTSIGALNRLLADPLVRNVSTNETLRPDSVSDLPFIDQPQTAAEGATGAGTTIAVIDGGLGNNYLNPQITDFGTCTAVDTPPSTCRVVYNQDFYPGASSETVHGTNVSAIALGVAPGASLAMFDVFNGTQASSSDVLAAMDTAIQDQVQYNIVAINLSLGNGSSNPTTCSSSVFATAVTDASDAGIVTVAAAGNSGSKTGLSDPACAPGVVSVGAVYNGSYGGITWNTGPMTQCTDSTTVPDQVTCFSQSASYLTLLGPGSFVSAPNSSFDESGTSQATPHVSGSVAVLRARYPAEPLSETVQRLQISGVQDTDQSSNVTTARIDLLGATNQGTSLTLTGTGPATGTEGTQGTYTLLAMNAGPLLATDVIVTDVLPSGAMFVSASTGCSVTGSTVTCTASSLGSGNSLTFTINIRWNVSGSVYDTASITADQLDTAPASQQTVAFGEAPDNGDAPVPLWAYFALGLVLLVIAERRGARARSGRLAIQRTGPSRRARTRG